MVGFLSAAEFAGRLGGGGGGLGGASTITDTGPIFCMLIKICIQTPSIFLELSGQSMLMNEILDVYSSRPHLRTISSTVYGDHQLQMQCYLTDEIAEQPFPCLIPGDQMETLLQTLQTLLSKSNIAQKDHPRRGKL